MPWVYTIRLTDKQSADQVMQAWQDAGGPPIEHNLGGVSVGGLDAVVVCSPRFPSYADLEAEPFVDVVDEHREIPARGAADFDPPYQLHPNGAVTLVE